MTTAETTNAETFVARFVELWRRPRPAEYASLWHDDGVLLHPEMKQAIPAKEIPAYVERLLELAPDIRLEPTVWAARADSVLIEWIINATINGHPTQWHGADRFTLRGDRAVEGVAYFDTLPLWRLLTPGLPSPDVDEMGLPVAAEPAAPEPAGNHDLLEAAQQYARAWSDHDVAAIVARHAQDMHLHVHSAGFTEASDPASVQEQIEGIFAMWEDLRFEVRSISTGGDFAVSEYRMSSGELAADAVDVIRFRGGLVARKDTYLELHGELDAPAGPAAAATV